MIICAIPKQAGRYYNYIVPKICQLNFIPSKVALLCSQETVRRGASFILALQVAEEIIVRTIKFKLVLDRSVSKSPMQQSGLSR